ncbi:amino acid/amide ABC transporter ATP-binding protein 2 (HAAT family) [Advenella incenata]|uniref:Amino acid/amide ABC transporter ATP-binding protein 2 (HAAT family) n=1 Tax=Advenella incenata TaxID=267800 RepID=A0A4V2FSN2_9BURK|nr:ABC transporter ATP-binding protein [Advenella incenata]RZT94865.1 amino acid/amide ABC transporter ATP-binding protein 2 (HAAT family) [Advenella incenata]
MLKINKLSAAYDGIKALKGVSLKVLPGEMVALIGPNGAGKSTLLNCISGTVRPSAGSILFKNSEISKTPAHRISQLGLLQVPEGRQILVDLSVEENLQLGTLALGKRMPRHTIDDVYDLFPILGERRLQRSGDLSGGQQQMLAIGRALVANPGLLLLDEPSLGLSPLITDLVFNTLKRLNEAGLAIFVVEQNALRALTYTQRAYILERGRVVLEGLSSDLLTDPRVAEHYLG